VNSDYEVNIADVNAVIDIILSGSGNLTAADVNGDHEVNIADVNAVIDIIFGGGPAPSNHEYVNLGLPSGTLWANVNDANGLTTYEDAVAKFGKQLPTKKQFTELREKCEWQNLKNGGYKVVGPNGNYITFPLTGFINCTGEFLNANKFGDYWTSTTDGTDEAYRVAFNEKNIIIALHPKCYARAIRLVK
jgi:hypothetical protein